VDSTSDYLAYFTKLINLPTATNKRNWVITTKSNYWRSLPQLAVPRATDTEPRVSNTDAAGTPNSPKIFGSGFSFLYNGPTPGAYQLHAVMSLESFYERAHPSSIDFRASCLSISYNDVSGFVRTYWRFITIIIWNVFWISDSRNTIVLKYLCYKLYHPKFCFVKWITKKNSLIS
jgi:hypothetical protein